MNHFHRNTEELNEPQQMSVLQTKPEDSQQTILLYCEQFAKTWLPENK
jgi:hypothetical protein